MSDPRTDQDQTAPTKSEDLWAQRRGKNIAILATILGLAVLFFVVTILRMS
ncbi:hypothetical protein T8K17_05960 [Thalassobaculum sp. OXR-137]|uniref:hypothetical protein n=1 Tax=Thalassobaculum sp. OXR-137 TaxID=3100173 RepID=UPI002AC986BD|nr:hypothetical protein [Thalassobaculum sp. OXR-137]WPZ35685.1 hypothetical protein T8K17_05960 [Thalassobaculum sp. OXR-137]